MAIPWTKVIGGVVTVAGIISGGAFGKRLLDRVGSIEQTIVSVTQTVARQADRAVEALPWERQLRMMDALITDCSTVAEHLRQECDDARSKLVGQVESMRRAMGLSKAPVGEWEVSAMIVAPNNRAFKLPPSALVDVPLPNLALTSDQQALEDAVAAEVGRAMASASFIPQGVEARRPLTDQEADSVVMASARSIVEAILPRYNGPVSNNSRPTVSLSPAVIDSPAVAACVRARGPFPNPGTGAPSPNWVQAHGTCAYEYSTTLVQAALLQAIRVFAATTPYAGADTATAVSSTAYRLSRPYNPYGALGHTVLTMDLAGLESLGSLADSLSIVLSVHKAGKPDSLFPGSQRQVFSGRALVRSPALRWRMDMVGLAWVGHGLVPRESAPVTPEELRSTRTAILALAAEVKKKYSPEPQSTP